MTQCQSVFRTFAVLAAFALPAWTSSAQDIRAVVHDGRGNPVTDARANCVRTNWDTPNDECGPAPVVATEHAHTRLASVYFEFNKSSLTPRSRRTLNELLATLRDKHIEEVTIAGYADAIGTRSYNKRLSEKRAEEVVHYLRAHGFPRTKTDIRALGESHARTVRECRGLKDGKLHACMQEDRRVDIELSVLNRR